MAYKTIRIIDTTLREGVQTPGVDFDMESSLTIARALAAIGVNMIECGHPFKSAAERARVQALVQADLGVPILAHSRAKIEDIDAVADTGAQWIGIFVGINHTTRAARVKGCTVAQILQIISNSVAHAKERGLMVRYTVEDASRTNVPDLQRAYEAAVDAGADRICYADTVGLLEPNQMKQTVETIKLLFPDTDLEIHIHDDRGLAMASSMAAVDAGANWISTSVNGIGERCGITDTITLLANLHHRRQRKLRPDLTETLIGVSRLVEELSGAPVDPRRPISGANAFRHKARLHRLAMMNDPDAYTWIAPDVVGADIELVED